MTTQLRFPEFNDEWQVKKLGDIAVKVSDRNNATSASTVLTNSAVHGVIPQTDFFDKEIAVQGNLSNYYKTELDDFVYNPRISTSAPVGPFKRNNYGSGVLSPLYNLYRFRGGQVLTFFEQYLKSIHWHKYMKDVANYGARSDRMAISSADLLALPLPYPSKPEQEKIADFLTAVDKRIVVGEKKLELLETYKRGAMQKIFSQQIRFKDESGKQYPDWEEKAVSEFLKERKEYTSKGGDLEHISLTTAGVVPKSERYERDFLVGSTDKQYRITRLDDICYNPANLKFGVIARNKYKDGIFSPIYVTYVVSNADIGFVEYLVTSRDFIQRARKYEQGTVYERMAVSPQDLAKLKVRMPVIEEQQKIATFLTTLDDKITAEKSKLTAARQFKKALLQRMFV